MTTKVTVDPANHKIEVAMHGTATVEKHVLEPGTAPRDFWIYGSRTIAIREITET